MKQKAIPLRQTLCYIAASGVFRASFGYALFLVRTRLSVFEYDMAGHIASARLFRENGFHGFSEQRFGGFIQNLFYPPLEDVAVSLIYFLTHNRFTAFQLFLSLGILGYGTVGWLLAHRMKTPFHKTLFLLFLVVFVRFGRAGTFSYQGMGMYDFFVVGLTSQLRGTVFFLLLVRERSGKKRNRLILLCTVGAVLSHLVMGMAACGFLAVAIAVRKEWRKFLVFMAAIGITACFRIPFLAYKDMLTSSAIRVTPPIVTIVVVLIALCTYSKEHSGYEYVSAAMLFMLPGVVQIFRNDVPLPHFHRYRLHSSALLLAGYGLFLGLTPKKHHSMNILSYGLPGALMVLMGRLLRQGGAYRRMVEPMSLQGIQRFADEFIVPENTRVLTFGNKRAGDFHQSTILHTMNTRRKTVGGLFRESHRSNILISSYMASLLGPGGFVLQGMHATDPTCDHYERIFEEFISRYAVGAFALPDERFMPYLSSTRRDCLNTILQKKTINNSYALSGPTRYTLQQTPFQVYVVTALPNSGVSNAMIVPVTTAMNVEYFPLDTAIPLDPIMTGTYDATVFQELRKTLFVTDRMAIDAITASRVEINEEPISLAMTQRAPGTYEIAMSGTQSSGAFFIKMHRYPGRQLTDANGKKLPLYDGFYGMIGIGHGTMVLEYRKPFAVWLSYVVSGIALLATLGIFLRRRSRDDS